MRTIRTSVALALLVAVAAPVVTAQESREGMDHAAHLGVPAKGLPTLAGQDAYGAIAEIVRLLEADSATDWSRVDLERLRQHLIAMNEVTLNAAVAQQMVPGGLQMDVTGDGRTPAAIRAMVAPHAAQLNRMPQWRAAVEELPNGARLTVVATDPGDERLVARIRGLGVIGLLTVDNHHAPHHLALARGARVAGH